MSLQFLGISVNQTGTGSITIPAGITNTPLTPEPDTTLFPYQLPRTYSERVNTLIQQGWTEAQAFDAIFDLIENEVVTLAGDFNSTAKDVTIWGRMESIQTQAELIYVRDGQQDSDYFVGVTIYVRVV